MTRTHHSRKFSCLLLVALFACLPVTVLAGNILVLGLFKDMVIIKVDDVQHKLRIGETSPEGVKLVSSNSDEAVLEVNGVRQSYTLGSHQNARSFTQTKKVSEARIWSQRGMYLTPGAINGIPVDFLVDTGASSVAMNTEHARRLGINYRYDGKRGAARTASGIVSTYMVQLKSVTVGNIELHNVEGAVIEGQGPTTILLGMSFLQHVKMQRDGNLLQLQKMR